MNNVVEGNLRYKKPGRKICLKESNDQNKNHPKKKHLNNYYIT
jgi:hypothetical protein